MSRAFLPKSLYDGGDIIWKTMIYSYVFTEHYFNKYTELKITYVYVHM
jgi:hypothetical protein